MIAPGSEIGLLDVRSGRLDALTAGREGAALGAPAWSPNGRRLAVTRQECPACPTRISLAEVASRTETPLPRTKGGDQPSWSPDGARLVFALSTATGRELVLVNGDGSNPEDLPVEREEHEGEASGNEGAQQPDEPEEVELPNHPTFSPDGSLIAFDAETSLERMRVFFYELATKEVREFHGPERHNGYPAFSPDGVSVAFSRSDPGGAWDVCLGETTAVGATCLTRGSAQDFEPAWSPDGKTVAFVSDRDDPRHVVRSLYVINLDGSGLRRLTSGFDAGEPAFSPDGKSIAFVRRELVALDGAASN